jgi:hypothetical protein
MMRLGEAVASLESLDSDATIYAAEPWTPDSRAMVACEGTSEAVAAVSGGMRYLREVRIAVDAVEVWSAWRAGRIPSADERCEAVIHYAVNDTYLPPA